MGLMLSMLSNVFGQPQTTASTNKLNGTWIPQREEFGGNVLPPAAFANQRLFILDSTYSMRAESVDKGVVVYHDDKMDIYGRDGINAGKHFTAIHKFQQGQLTICYNLNGDAYPESFDTKGKPLYFLCVFKKEDIK